MYPMLIKRTIPGILMKTAEYWIKALSLEPHPEGGFYKEIYRNKLKVTSKKNSQNRNAATSIYYLLNDSDKSHFHRLKSDEIWYHHEGGTLIVCMIDESGKYIENKLGKNPEQNEELQIIVPAGTIFGAYVAKSSGYVLMGCMVNPGFEFEDFEIMERGYLLEQYPGYRKIIELLT